jgi:hypothetical protein
VNYVLPIILIVKPIIVTIFEHVVQSFFNDGVFMVYVLGATPNHEPLK